MSASMIATLFLCAVSISTITCSIVPHAVPGLRYTLVAPQNIRPFAAQVSTFTRGLNVFAAPYAAGVIGGPAIITRGVTGPAVFPEAVHPVVPVPHAGLIPAAQVGVPVLPAPQIARSVHAVAPALG
nr:uncharacterized protein LOC111502858 [Leptinotarsa decemlineata]